MIKHRRNVFETNSSSTHSLTIGGELEVSKLPIDKNGNIIITLFDFDCYGTVSSQQEKLAWCILQTCAETGCYFSYFDNREDQQDTYNEWLDSCVAERIKEMLIEYTGAKGIRFKRGTTGQIDHQSQYGSLDEFLTENKIDFIDFVFSNGTFILLGRD